MTTLKMGILRVALGFDQRLSGPPGYRNYYVVARGTPTFESLQSMLRCGYVKSQPSIQDEKTTTFVVTKSGMALAGMPEAKLAWALREATERFYHQKGLDPDGDWRKSDDEEIREAVEALEEWEEQFYG